MLNYYNYIKSVEWFAKTLEIRKRNGGRCECCQMRNGSSVHHRTYERLGEELPEDLIHVCDCCHKMIHKIATFFIWDTRKAFLSQLQLEVQKNDNNRDSER